MGQLIKLEGDQTQSLQASLRSNRGKRKGAFRREVNARGAMEKGRSAGLLMGRSDPII